MSDLKVFVWTGEGVLKAYSTGLVVVIAEDELSAWEKMKAQQFGVFCNLFHGAPSYFDLQYELDYWMKEEVEYGNAVKAPILPAVYDLAEAPVLHNRGSD